MVQFDYVVLGPSHFYQCIWKLWKRKYVQVVLVHRTYPQAGWLLLFCSIKWQFKIVYLFCEYVGRWVTHTCWSADTLWESVFSRLSDKAANAFTCWAVFGWTDSFKNRSKFVIFFQAWLLIVLSILFKVLNGQWLGYDDEVI